MPSILLMLDAGSSRKCSIDDFEKIEADGICIKYSGPINSQGRLTWIAPGYVNSFVQVPDDATEVRFIGTPSKIGLRRVGDSWVPEAF